MTNRTRIMTAAQSNDRKERGRAIGAGDKNEPQTKTVHTTWTSIPCWSKESLEQRVKKVKRDLERRQQEREGDAAVFVGNNTCRRGGLNLVFGRLEEGMQKIAHTTTKQVGKD